MDVSIVIPNYNGMKYMENCLRALEKQRVEGEPETEILVVDNGSKDGSRELVEEKFRRVDHLRGDRGVRQPKINNSSVKGLWSQTSCLHVRRAS